MRLRPIFLIITILGLAPAALAAATGSDTDHAHEELAALERAWIDAEINRDPVALDRIIDDQFVCTFLVGKPIGKRDFIKSETLPGPKETQDLSDETMIVSGDTAVVVNTDTLHGVRNGAPYAETARITATYIKRAGHWRALAEHIAWETKPAAPKP